MSKQDLPPIIIRYTGLFEFEGIYKIIIDWCKNYGYTWEEETYKHKVPSPRGAEQEFRWIAEKEVTDYLKYKIEMEAHGWDMTEIVMEKDGKKKSLTNARFEIIIKGIVITDWQGKWKKGRLPQFLGNIYEKFVIRRELDGLYADGLFYRLLSLQTLLKKFFDMQTKWNEYKGYLGGD